MAERIAKTAEYAVFRDGNNFQFGVFVGDDWKDDEVLTDTSSSVSFSTWLALVAIVVEVLRTLDETFRETAREVLAPVKYEEPWNFRNWLPSVGTTASVGHYDAWDALGKALPAPIVRFRQLEFNGVRLVVTGSGQIQLVRKEVLNPSLSAKELLVLSMTVLADERTREVSEEQYGAFLFSMLCTLGFASLDSGLVEQAADGKSWETVLPEIKGIPVSNVTAPQAEADESVPQDWQTALRTKFNELLARHGLT